MQSQSVLKTPPEMLDYFKIPQLSFPSRSANLSDNLHVSHVINTTMLNELTFQSLRNYSPLLPRHLHALKQYDFFVRKLPSIISLMFIMHDTVLLIDSSSKRFTISFPILSALYAKSDFTILECELIHNTIFLNDVLYYEGNNMTKLPYWQRIDLLKDLHTSFLLNYETVIKTTPYPCFNLFLTPTYSFINLYKLTNSLKTPYSLLFIPKKSEWNHNQLLYWNQDLKDSIGEYPTINLKLKFPFVQDDEAVLYSIFRDRTYSNSDNSVNDFNKIDTFKEHYIDTAVTTTRLERTDIEFLYSVIGNRTDSEYTFAFFFDKIKGLWKITSLVHSPPDELSNFIGYLKLLASRIRYDELLNVIKVKEARH